MNTPDLFNHIPEPEYTPPFTAAETLFRYGARTMSEVQLLQVLGIPEATARAIMQRMGNTLGALSKLTAREIAETKGIGNARAAAIVGAFEIGRRRATEPAQIKAQISTSLDAYELINSGMRDLTQEEFWVIYLDRLSRLLSVDTLHKGGMSSMVVDPKIIFQAALRYKASSLILAHNHPSGSPSPSMEDIRLTEKVKMAGTYIDIKVLDHVIIGDGSFYSFADEGKM